MQNKKTTKKHRKLMAKFGREGQEKLRSKIGEEAYRKRMRNLAKKRWPTNKQRSVAPVGAGR